MNKKKEDPNRYRNGARQNIDADYVDMVGGISKDLLGPQDDQKEKIISMLQHIITLLDEIAKNTFKGY